MSKKSTMKPLAAAIGTAVVASLVSVSLCAGRPESVWHEQAFQWIYGC
ncbi:MAG: hypothetical protein ACREVE_04245 [Gammaproteobacteria bacterium]